MLRALARVSGLRSRYANHVVDGACFGGEGELEGRRRVGDERRVDGGWGLREERAEGLALGRVAVRVAREGDEVRQVEGLEGRLRQHRLCHRDGEVVDGRAVEGGVVGALDDAKAENAFLLERESRTGELRDRSGGRCDLRWHINCGNQGGGEDDQSR